MASSAANPVDAQVFISYAQDEDGAAAFEVADHLEAAGVSVWIADRSIDGAQNYGPEVVAAIDRCRVLVVLCSAASLHSGHVAVEVELAFEAKRPRLPLRLDDTPFPDQIRYWLTGSNWIDVRGPADDWVPKVLRSLERHGVECGGRPVDVTGGPAGATKAGTPLPAPLPVSELEYARAADGTQVAYRVIDAGAGGDPGVDVVMASGGLFPMELLQEDPGFVRLVTGLRAIGRVVLFDRRGIGLSDPVVDWERPILDQWADDLAAVVDASGAPHAVVYGWDSYGVATRFAARHPDPLRLLVLHQPFMVPEEDWDPSVADWSELVRKNLGGGQDLLERIAPSHASDESFRDWYVRAGRAGASPTTAARIWDSVFSSRPSDQLYGEIETPTLVVLRRDSVYLSAEVARVAAAQIRGATLVELDGADHFPFLGDVDAVIRALHDFAGRQLPQLQLVLTAILVSELVPTGPAGSSDDEQWRSALDRHDATVRAAVTGCGGEVVKTAGDGVVAFVPSAGAAVQAAQRARHELAADGLEARIAVHVGDVERRDDEVSGPGVTVATGAMAVADAGQVVVTASVPAAIGRTSAFNALGRHELAGLAGEWELFGL